jgi:hypothetical protein
MKLNQKRFEEVLRRHKKMIAGLKFSIDEHGIIDNDTLTGRLIAVERTGRELSLAYSGLKCEKCGATERLQFHHLIMRQIKEFTDFFRYESQRKYWANILVLCGQCHQEIHTSLKQFPKHDIKVNPYIKPKLIAKVKAKYFEEEEKK